jgi:chemotaxis protein histidine kinase CheA
MTEYEEIRLTEAIENQLNIYVISFTVSEDKVHDATTNLLAELNNLGEAITVSPQSEQGQMQFEIILTTDYDIEKVRGDITSLDVVIKRLYIEKKSPPASPEEKDVLLPLPMEQIVRVKIQELDSLMNLVGELVINRSAIAQIGEEIFKQMGDDSKDLKKALKGLLKELGKLTSSLQQSIMKSRMVPISQIFNNYPRLVRDLAKRNGKEIQLFTKGEGTELDKKITEEINDPLVHLIRNACDHGIEEPEEREK